MEDMVQMAPTKKEKSYTLITADEYEESDIRVSLGNPLINQIIGGGIRPGDQVETYGKWSTGKTILGWTLLREAQELGAKTFLAEAEAAFNKAFATKCGLDLKKTSMLVSTKEQPLTAPVFFEAFEDEMKASQRHYPFFVGVLDSLASLNAALIQKDGKKAYSNQYYAAMAREMSQGLNRLKPMLRPHNAILFIVNQVRDNVGVMFGDKITTPGGNAVKFYSDLRIQLKNAKKVADGILVKLYIAKSKLAPPFGEAEVRFDFNIGLDPVYGKEEKEENGEA